MDQDSTDFSDVGDRQILPSVSKLLNYLLVFTKKDINVNIIFKGKSIGSELFKAPSEINISPTLYTRIDNCHGAGLCCMVEFDLVYTTYDYQRIVDFDVTQSEREFGKQSTETFQFLRERLLKALEPIIIEIDGHLIHAWIQRNREINKLSQRLSCNYLLQGQDRYFCGVHPFKPLHCWMPHMTIRQYDNEIGRPTVQIGRNQYGRNHKFGCPVIFKEAGGPTEHLLIKPDTVNYFEHQYRSDYEKLRWISQSTASLGCTIEDNFAVGIHKVFAEQASVIRNAFACGVAAAIPLWRNTENRK